MAIPEGQLETWSNRGAEQGSLDAIESVAKALASHNWPDGMQYEPYLQGSYPNETNIRGDSDVDMVVELKTSFYHNVTDGEVKKALGFTDSKYGFDDFWKEVFDALTGYYNPGTVIPGDKSIKVLGGNTNRLDADVVPCVSYKHYQGTSLIAEGIKFWTRQSGQVIVNYPKLHLQQGHFMEGSCNGDYKGTIRILKNARTAKAEVSDLPSYFIEGLCSNLSTACFTGTRQNTLLNSLNELHTVSKNGQLINFVAQNGVQKMFGDQPYQVPLDEGEEFIGDIANLWNNWK